MVGVAWSVVVGVYNFLLSKLDSFLDILHIYLSCPVYVPTFLAYDSLAFLDPLPHAVLQSYLLSSSCSGAIAEAYLSTSSSSTSPTVATRPRCPSVVPPSVQLLAHLLRLSDFGSFSRPVLATHRRTSSDQPPLTRLDSGWPFRSPAPSTSTLPRPADHCTGLAHAPAVCRPGAARPGAGGHLICRLRSRRSLVACSHRPRLRSAPLCSSSWPEALLLDRSRWWPSLPFGFEVKDCRCSMTITSTWS